MITPTIEDHLTVPADTDQVGGSQKRDFSILLVCRANQCRSPMAESLVQAKVDSLGLPISVSSAGTHAVFGLPMDPLARRALEDSQLEPAEFASRPLTELLIEGSHLILTMTDAQRTWVVAHYPRAVRRTFLLSQFSHLVEATRPPGPMKPREWGPSLLARATEGRGLTQPLTRNRDVADPIGGSLRRFRTCASILDSHVRPLFTGIELEGHE